MSQKITLGGERLGSGKKNKIELKSYERSTHDLSFIFRSTMSSGTLVPFMCEVALPGDTFDIKLEADILTLPTVAPLFGSYKVQLDVFKVPIRLYNNLLHNNKLGIGMNMSQVTLPRLNVHVRNLKELEKKPENIDYCQVNPSCILSYLGLRGYGYNNTGSTVQRSFNGVPLLAYWEIYKNYYANKQETDGWVIHKISYTIEKNIETFTITTYPPATNNDVLEYPNISAQQNPYIKANDFFQIVCTGGSTPPAYKDILVNIENIGWVNLTQFAHAGSLATVNNIITGNVSAAYANLYVVNFGYADILGWNSGTAEVVNFPLSHIDDMREAILRGGNNPFDIYGTNLTPYSWLGGMDVDNNYFTQSTQEGLGLKTHQSDIFNNWLQTTWIDEINAATAVSVVANKFNIDQLILARKVYEMLTRVAVSGGSYKDWIDAVYDHNMSMAAESPIYEGGLIKELVFQEVISNVSSPTQPLGTLAGRGKLGGKHKGGIVNIKCDEHSYIMGIVSITPRIDYSQGNRWDVNLQSMDDFHKPQLDEIGFQDLITEKMAWWTTYSESNTWQQQAAGKQPAWLDYMTNFNRTYGDFALAKNSMYMTLNRKYSWNENTVVPNIKDLTTYIDPSKFNFVFASTKLDSQNFWTQIGCDITARRKMSAKVMPNL